MSGSTNRLVGNRLALVGAGLYFLEWVGISLAPSLPTDKLGTNEGTIIATYADHPAKTAFLAGWLSLVLLGRIAFCVGLRDAFRQLPRSLRLADLAIGLMAVSVVIEIVDYGLVATGAWLAQAGAAPGTVAAFDTAGTTLFTLVLAPAGAAVLCGSLAMLLSGLFARWLSWLGIAAGGLLAVGGVEVTAAAGSSGSLHDLGSLPLPLVWVWLIATGVVLFRAAPSRRRNHVSDAAQPSQLRESVV
jgi:hypothetical protein